MVERGAVLAVYWVLGVASCGLALVCLFGNWSLALRSWRKGTSHSLIPFVGGASGLLGAWLLPPLDWKLGLIVVVLDPGSLLMVPAAIWAAFGPAGKGPRASSPRRYHLNVVGDFYVEDGCCTMCGVPYENEAPDLFGVDGDEHCYVKKQPGNPAELERMLNAIKGAELKCIRYAGHDPAILEELEAAHEVDVCDYPARRTP